MDVYNKYHDPIPPHSFSRCIQHSRSFFVGSNVRSGLLDIMYCMKACVTPQLSSITTLFVIGNDVLRPDVT